jgi:predicted N-acyltransferase
MADLTIQVLDSIDQVAPAEWDELGSLRAFADHRWLRFAERVLIGHQPRYIVLRREGRLEAGAVCSVEHRFENRALQRHAAWLLRRFPCIRCAVPASYQPGILTRPDADEARLIPSVLGAVRQLARRERALFTTVSHLAPETATWSALRAAGCRPLSRWSGTTLPIAWSSFDEYLTGQSRSHRRTIVRTRRAAEQDGIVVRHRPGMPADATVLWRLIQNVMERHRALETYAPDLLSRAAAIFGDDLHLLVAEQAGECIGCVVAVRSGNDLLAKWIGLDYDRTRDTATYRLLLAETVALAIELGVERLWLGATALETKRQFGVTVEERLNAVLVPSPLRWLVGATGAA